LEHGGKSARRIFRSGQWQPRSALASSGGGSGLLSPPIRSPGNGSGPSQGQFTYYPVYVLDNNDGVVWLPGVFQLEALGGYVDLIAQVSNTAASSYSWHAMA
jgi:hypothetical protein